MSDEDKKETEEEVKDQTTESAEEVDDSSVETDEDLAEALGAIEENQIEVSGENLDKMIHSEDPNFQNELSKINKDDFSGLKISQDQVAEDVTEDEKGPPLWKSFYDNLPKEQKVKIYAALAVVVVGAPLIFFLLKGMLLPEFEIPYVVSMKELSKKVHSYPTDGVQVPLFDDYRSQAFTMAMPKTMINLKREGGEPSYGQFEFFFNLREKELASVIQSRETEIIDLLQRTLEQITWRELQTPMGKEKVKKVVRHRINDFLQGNIILGVYYKSVLLQK